MMKSLNFTLLLTIAIVVSSCSDDTGKPESTENKNTTETPESVTVVKTQKEPTYSPIKFSKLEIDMNSGQLFESQGYSVRIPNGWSLDLMGPFKDSLGRTHSNAGLLTDSYENSLNVAIYRYGFEIVVEEEISAMMNDISEDEDVSEVNKIEEENSTFGGVETKKVTVTYMYDGIESMYINTAYFFNDSNNSFVISIDYALEDESKYTEDLALMNQTFQVIPYK